MLANGVTSTKSVVTAKNLMVTWRTPY